MLTGDRVSSKYIYVHVRGADMPDLVLVDMPGLRTRDDTEEKNNPGLRALRESIENMVLEELK